jgi:HEAT repeat protein
MTQSNPTAQKRQGGEATPAGRNLSEWFRQLDRFLRMVRTFGPSAPNSVSGREKVLEDFMGILRSHAPILLHCTPLEIWLCDEAIVHPPGAHEGEGNIERRIPFLLYRDGIRSLTFSPETTRGDIEALLDALGRVTTSQMTNEDLVTLLWEAELTGLRVDVAPVEQTLRVRPFAESPVGGPATDFVPEGVEWPDGKPDGADPHPSPVRPPEASPTQAPAHEGGSGEAPNESFEDWPVPDSMADPVQAWSELREVEDRTRDEFLAEWAREHSSDWTATMPGLAREALALDPGPNTTEALVHTLVTWLGSAIQRCEWQEAGQAMAALQEVDPTGEQSAPALTSMLQAIDAEAVAERLDESEPEAQGQFFALSVRAGRPALDLIVGVLATATRVRLRAAATTALCYLCADQPRELARYLSDSRWYLVRNIVFVLGQIGGDQIVPLLANTTRHADVRVRRTVVNALGQAPREQRLPLLIELLESPDGQVVSSALAMLARESDPSVTESLLERVTALDFSSRPDDVKSSLISALGETADENVVPALEQILQKGGWFARRTAERTAAAQTLARLGTPAAMEVLRTGLESRSEAIRASCQEGLARHRWRAA